MSRPDLDCCRPWRASFPSPRWVHSRWCDLYPGQEVGRERQKMDGTLKLPLKDPDYIAAHSDDEDDERTSWADA